MDTTLLWSDKSRDLPVLSKRARFGCKEITIEPVDSAIIQDRYDFRVAVQLAKVQWREFLFAKALC